MSLAIPLTQPLPLPCRVCQNIIHVGGGNKSRVVKCSSCNEATVRRGRRGGEEGGGGGGGGVEERGQGVQAGVFQLQKAKHRVLPKV